MTTLQPHGSAPTLLGRTWFRIGVIMFVVVIVGGIVTQAVRKPGVYWSDAHVRFVAPANPVSPNSLQVSERSLVMTAGAVGQAVDDRNLPATASPDVHLSGLGVRSGYSITLPNNGGQFAPYFNAPYLDVQVVGPSEVQVAATMKRLIAKIESKLTELQDKSKVVAANRIGAKVLPLTNAPVYLERGSRTRAFAAALVIIVGAAAATASALSRLERRRARRARRGRRRDDSPVLVG